MSMWGVFPEVSVTCRDGISLMGAEMCACVFLCFKYLFNLWTNINRHKHIIMFKYKGS